MDKDKGNKIYDLQRDPLTWAFTRHSYKAVFNELVKKTIETKTSLSLVIIDIDYFKSVNDAYGHLKGDRILHQISQRILSIIRETDLFFRYGGDEFILLIPHTDRVTAAELAHKIRERTSAVPFPGDPPLTVTLSMGFATFPDDTTNSDDLFKIADKRTYEAKRQGRDRVITETTEKNRELPFDTLSRLVERDNQLQVGNGFLNALIEEKRGLFKIIGEGRSGKSRFLLSMSERAALKNFQVISINASRELKGIPYAAISSMDGLPSLPFQDDIETIIASFKEEILLPHKEGVIFAIDNASELDTGTRTLLKRIFTDKEIECEAIIYTIDPDKEQHIIHNDFLYSEEVELYPLTRQGLLVWVRSLLSLEPPESFLNWLHTKTAGYPGLVKQVLNYLLKKEVIFKFKQDSWYIKNEYDQIKIDINLTENGKIQPRNIPTLLSEFFGRDKEILEIQEAVENHKLVSMLGPGGIGKTRLSIKIANTLAEKIDYAIYFIPLDSIREPELVATKIAEVLGVEEQSNLPLVDSIANFIGDQQYLFILDNFEQIVDAAPLVSQLLKNAPNLKIIVTTREILNITGEFCYRVNPLTLPTEDAKDINTTNAADYSAIQLFIDRAKSVKPNFAVTKENLPIIVSICRRLNGLPLAIELATARLRLLPLKNLLERLNKSLKILTTGPQDLPIRHQTMRSTIAWSYELLSEQEQKLFRRLGVFLGIYSYDAIQSICVDEGIQIDELLDLLESLINKSLVLQVENQQGNLGFKMLETIREYALEMQAEHNEVYALKEKHAAFYLELAENSEEELSADQQDQWVSLLFEVQDNVRGALLWIIENNKMEMALRFIGAIWKYWHMCHHLAEGRKWIMEILPQSMHIRTSNRVKALWGGGWIFLTTSDTKQSEICFTEGVELAQEVGDRRSAGLCLHGIGAILRLRSDAKKAQEIFNQSLDIFKDIGDVEHIAWTYQHLGVLAHEQNDTEVAIDLLKKSIDLFEQLRMLWPLAEAFGFLGDAYLEIKDFAKAKELYKKSAALYEEVDDSSSMRMARITGSLGRIAFEEGDLGKAKKLYRESILRLKELHDSWGILLQIGHFAEVAFEEEEIKRGIALYGAVKSLSKSLDMALPPIESNQLQNPFEIAKKKLSESELEIALQIGNSMTIEEAISYVLDRKKGI